MDLKQHEQRTLGLIGIHERYTEIHISLDQYFPMLGPCHRPILHHHRGIYVVQQKHSHIDPDIVQMVCERHILDDLGVDDLPYDWREYDVEIEYLDQIAAKNTKRPPGQVLAIMRKLYPDY
tara:strand:- start:279 stop:641 length:363 start_codon:yes stop_codon:yes gene_type:complete